MTRALFSSIGLAVVLAGCAAKPAPVVGVAPPPVVATIVAPVMPAGGYPGMRIPARLPGGSYPTPNRALTPDAATWHLRAALNVAALACRAGGDPLVAGYNAMLTGRRAALVQVERRYAAQWGTSPAGRDGYDDAMTRLYNFYARPVGHGGFCAAAAETLALLPGVADADLPAFAADRLARLDRPFTDFYAAFDAWASGQRPIIAIAAPVPTAPPPPRLEVDPAIFQLP
ncbi:MAG TPA: hypothetical protein VF695_15390 [Sphingomonas sp.]